MDPPTFSTNYFCGRMLTKTGIEPVSPLTVSTENKRLIAAPSPILIVLI
jgi:hypothetical protein